MSTKDCQTHDGISIENPKTKWNDIIGCERAKDVLNAEIVLPTRFPRLFEGRRRPYNPVLLYGPREIDNWRLAEAAAGEAGVRLLSMDSWDWMMGGNDTTCVC